MISKHTGYKPLKYITDVLVTDISTCEPRLQYYALIWLVSQPIRTGMPTRLQPHTRATSPGTAYGIIGA